MLKRIANSVLCTINASAETRDGITDEDKALIKAVRSNKTRAVKIVAETALKRLEQN